MWHERRNIVLSPFCGNYRITDEKPTKEMVRRLIPPLCQEDGGGSF
jgi:hypothetical protein